MSSPSKNIFWLTLSRVISLILLFLAYILLTSYLGAYRFGQYQFVLSFVALFGVVIDFGIQQYVIKKISEDRSKAKKYFQNFLIVEIILAFLVYAAMLIVAKLSNYESEVMTAIAIAGLGTAINGLTYPFLSVITSFYELRRAAFINFLSSVINFSLILITIWTGHGIVLLATQQLIFSIIAVIVYYNYVQKHIGRPEILKFASYFDWKLIKSILKAALPFALLVGFSTVYNRIDVILITKILGYHGTGLYTAAYKFYDLLAFFPAVVSFALYPLFASLMAENKIGEIKEIMQKYLRFMAALALPIGMGGMLLAPQIMGILKPEFMDAAPVLAILVWAPSILFLYIVVNSLVISQLTKWAMIITGVNVVINIIGNLILLPTIGIRGAAIMTIVSELLQGIFYFYFVYTKITKFAFFSLVWKPILAALVMGGVVWQIRHWSLIPAVLIGAVIYAVTLLVLRFYHKDDIEFVRSFLNRGGTNA